MNFRRAVWVALLAALGVMLVMMYLQEQARKQPLLAEQGKTSTPRPPERASTPATKPAPAPMPATAPAPSPPAAVTTKEVTVPIDKPPRPKPGQPDRWSILGGDISERVKRGDAYDRVLGSLDQDAGYTMRVELTSVGAAISRIELTEHFVTVADKRRHKKDPKTYHQAVADDPKLKGNYTLLKPPEPGIEKNLSLATHEVSLDGKSLPLGDVYMRTDPQTTETIIRSRWSSELVVTDPYGTQRVTFVCQIGRNGKDFARLEKTYSLAKGSHSVEVELRVVNLAGEKFKYSLIQLGPTGLSREGLRSDERNVTYARLVEGNVDVVKESIAKAKELVSIEQALKKPLGHSIEAKSMLWIAQTNKFFAAIAYVVPAKAEALDAPEAQASFFNASLDSNSFLPGMVLGAYELEANQAKSVKLDLFAGAKRRDVFNDNPRYKALAYEETLSFRDCWCSFRWLALGMMWLLNFLTKAALGNYGIGIILMVVLVRVALHPLTKRSQVSMAKMQKLNPEIQKLREKYKSDKSKLNEETMKLYKSQGASPLLGCLPMFLQFPIWIALWTSINASVELRHAAFLPVWITDLAAPDALIEFGRNIWTIPLGVGPLIGFNLLPILLCVAMFLQTKLNPQMSGASASPEQQSSMKMMKYMMPAMMLVFFYNAPSGLTMYIMTSISAGVAEQYIIRKHIRNRDAREAAVETKVAMPGKHFRGKKPKKPKGPFQIKH